MAVGMEEYVGSQLNWLAKRVLRVPTDGLRGSWVACLC